MDVFRLGVDDPVDCVLISEETLPPRLNKKGKVVWRLPLGVETLELASEEDHLPSFGTDERRRILELFRENRKDRRKNQRKKSVVESASTVPSGADEDAIAAIVGGGDSRVAEPKEGDGGGGGEEEEKGGHDGSLAEEKDGSSVKGIVGPTMAQNADRPALGDVAAKQDKKKKKKKKRKTALASSLAEDLAVAAPPSTLDPVAGFESNTTSTAEPSASGEPSAERGGEELPGRPSSLETDHLPTPKPPPPNTTAPAPSTEASPSKIPPPPPGMLAPPGFHSSPTSDRSSIPDLSPLHTESSPLDSIPVPQSQHHDPPQQQQQQRFPQSNHKDRPATSQLGRRRRRRRHHQNDRFLIIPESDRPAALVAACFAPPPQPSSSLAAPAARALVDLYYNIVTKGDIAALAAHYTPTAQRSVSVGGAHSVVAGRRDLSDQLLRLSGSTFVVRGVVAMDTYDGRGVHILATGVLSMPGGGSATAFAHSITLAPAYSLLYDDAFSPEDESDDDPDLANNADAFEWPRGLSLGDDETLGWRNDNDSGLSPADVPFAYQIHNDAMSLLGEVPI